MQQGITITMWGRPWQRSYEVDEVFVDTAGWAVLFVRTEPQHAQVSALFRQWKRLAGIEILDGMKRGEC